MKAADGACLPHGCPCGFILSIGSRPGVPRGGPEEWGGWTKAVLSSRKAEPSRWKEQGRENEGCTAAGPGAGVGSTLPTAHRPTESPGPAPSPCPGPGHCRPWGLHYTKG